MNFKELKNKKIYIAPFSSITLFLYQLLCQNGIHFLGFIDEKATGKNIITKKNIKRNDFIIICSPNHHKAILKSLSAYSTRQVYYYNSQFYFDSIPSYVPFLNSIRNFLEPIQIRSFKNRHPNGCAIILHTPSSTLNLHNIIHPIFASHTILPILQSTSWRPDYLAITDFNDYIKHENFISHITQTTKFFPKYFLSYSGKRIKKSFYLNQTKILNSFDLDKSLYTHFSITFTLISIAIYMGCKELFIYGMSINSVKLTSFRIANKYNNPLHTKSFDQFLPIRLNSYYKECNTLLKLILPYRVKIYLTDQLDNNIFTMKNKQHELQHRF